MVEWDGVEGEEYESELAGGFEEDVDGCDELDEFEVDIEEVELRFEEEEVRRSDFRVYFLFFTSPCWEEKECFLFLDPSSK